MNNNYLFKKRYPIIYFNQLGGNLWNQNLSEFLEFIESYPDFFIKIDNTSREAGGHDFDHDNYYKVPIENILYSKYLRYIIRLINPEKEEYIFDLLNSNLDFKIIIIAYMKGKNVAEKLNNLTLKEDLIQKLKNFIYMKNLNPKELKAVIKFWNENPQEYINIEKNFELILSKSDNIFADLNFKVENLTTYCILIVIRIIWDVNNTDKLPEWFLTKDFGEINGHIFKYQTIKLFLEINLTLIYQDLTWHNDYFSNINPIFITIL